MAIFHCYVSSPEGIIYYQLSSFSLPEDTSLAAPSVLDSPVGFTAGKLSGAREEEAFRGVGKGLHREDENSLYTLW